MPTKPAPSAPETTSILLLSAASTATSLPALTVALLPMKARVVLLTTGTVTAPAMPTVPPPTAALIASRFSSARARSTTSSLARTVAPLPMEASVVMVITDTPTAGEMPAPAATASAPATSRW